MNSITKRIQFDEHIYEATVYQTSRVEKIHVVVDHGLVYECEDVKKRYEEKFYGIVPERVFKYINLLVDQIITHGKIGWCSELQISMMEAADQFGKAENPKPVESKTQPTSYMIDIPGTVLSVEVEKHDDTRTMTLHEDGKKCGSAKVDGSGSMTVSQSLIGMKQYGKYQFINMMMEILTQPDNTYIDKDEVKKIIIARARTLEDMVSDTINTMLMYKE